MFEEVCVDKDKKQWMEAMRDGMGALMANQTLDLVPLPTKRKTLQNKWVYRLKEEVGGKKWYKARLVVKGHAQKKGGDFKNIFHYL